jgi:hypothetical protein
MEDRGKPELTTIALLLAVGQYLPVSDSFTNAIVTTIAWYEAGSKVRHIPWPDSSGPHARARDGEASWCSLLLSGKDSRVGVRGRHHSMMVD